MKNESKQERQLQELNRLEKIFAILSKNDHDFIMPLLEQAAFMFITLEDIEEAVNSAGSAIDSQKVCAYMQAYNHTAKTYHNLMIKLYDRRKLL